ncbi:Biotin-Acetyl-CoA carboxylase-ligase [Corynebacterium ulcerans]|nr:Biotin-Acetyl-CoA carboxylase-ligase [Corynebacterium ulcerans]
MMRMSTGSGEMVDKDARRSTLVEKGGGSRDSRTPLNVGWLREQLIDDGPFARILHSSTTGSTNTDLVAAAHEGAPAWTVVLTEHQTLGRGRMGRRYEAPAGAQLTLSVLIRPPRESVFRLGTMPLATGLALIDALKGAEGVGLKWPNDLLCEGRKLCGILAEAVSLGEEPAVVIGLGLNTSLTREELPVPHATSLELEGIPYERNELAVRVLTALHRRLRQWEDNDPTLLTEYRQVCTSIGADVRVILSENEELLGVAESVSDAGLICVRDSQGELHELMAGDVTHLRLQDK